MSLSLESLGEQYGRFCFVKTLFTSICLFLLLLDLRVDNKVKRCITLPTKTYNSTTVKAVQLNKYVNKTCPLRP